MSDTDFCDTCKAQGKQVQATAVCKNCREIYCHECEEIHKNFKATRSHSVASFKGRDEMSAKNGSGAGSNRSLASGSIHGSEMGRRSAASASSSADVELNGIFQSEIVKPKAIREVNLERIIDERILYIRGVVSLPDDSVIVLIERKLLIFDANFRYRCSLPVLECPEHGQGIVVVDAVTVAVLEMDYIGFFHVGDMGVQRLDNHIQLDCVGNGLAYNGKYFAIVCEPHRREAFIRIVDKDGSVVNTVHVSEAFFMKMNLSGYIAMEPGQDLLYVSDSYHRRIVCLSLEGNPIWETHINANTYGISVLKQCLLVCTMNYEAVHQISKTGRYVKQIVTEQASLAQPKFLCWQKNRHRIVVACYTVGYPFCTAVEF